MIKTKKQKNLSRRVYIQEICQKENPDLRILSFTND